MKKIYFLFLVLSLFVIPGVAQTIGEEWYQKGEEALFMKDKSQDAAWYYKKAAELGNSDACGRLAMLYYFSELTGKRDIEKAIEWANKVEEGKNDDCEIVLGLIAYYRSDFKNALKHFGLCKGNLTSEAIIAMEICNLQTLPIIGGRQMVMPDPFRKSMINSLRRIYDRYYTNRNSYFYSATAILAKLEFEKKFKFTKKVIQYLHVVADDDEDCPLANCLIGLYLRHDCGQHAEGRKFLKHAAEYQYTDNRYEVLYPFAKEIISWHNK